MLSQTQSRQRSQVFMRELVGSFIATVQYHAVKIQTAVTFVVFVGVLWVCLEIATGTQVP